MRTSSASNYRARRVELVKVHLSVELRPRVEGEVFQPSLHAAAQPRPLRHQAYVTPSGEHIDIPVYSSSASTGLQAHGPMLVEHAGSTVWVRDADEVRICSDGCVLIRHLH